MAVPNLGESDVLAQVPEIEVVGPRLQGGQKVVFPCRLHGELLAFKAMLTNPAGHQTQGSDSDDLDEVSARARREVQTMQEIDSPHLVKLGPIPLSIATVGGQEIVYFAEEWIEGDSVRTLLDSSGPFSISEVIGLGVDATEAIDLLWQRAKIHRDVKPQNIMRRASTGEYVLLDLGLVFDLGEDSLTMFGMVAGTPIYFSPEQTEFSRKRQLDFRSDLFSLGIVLYETLTGVHPFTIAGASVQEIVGRILTHQPDPPSARRAEVPPELDALVMRLLAKQPHLRFGSCAQLADALRAIRGSRGRG